jgi:hypothetical protein
LGEKIDQRGVRTYLASRTFSGVLFVADKDGHAIKADMLRKTMRAQLNRLRDQDDLSAALGHPGEALDFRLEQGNLAVQVSVIRQSTHPHVLYHSTAAQRS